MRPRIHVPPPCRAGTTMALPPAAARHVQVLRLQPGAAITVFDGSGALEWPATVLTMSRSAVSVRLDEPVGVSRELPWAVTLALGVPANDRMDALVEKAGELGAAVVQPLVCERSVLRLSGERAEARRRHWQGVAVAASEQCGRTRLTEIAPLRPLAGWLDGIGPPGAAACRLVLSFDACAAAAPAALAGLWRDGGEARAIVVLSGPEGGLGGSEEAAAVARGFVRTSLGPRVLRADTAPLALLAWLGLQAAPGEAR